MREQKQMTDTLASHRSQIATLHQCLCIHLKLTCASTNAFHPCVLKFGAAKISTSPIPNTPTPATTGFAGFVGAALGTHGTRRTGCARDSGDFDNPSHHFCGNGKTSVTTLRVKICKQTHWRRTIHNLLRYIDVYGYI